MDKSFFEHRPVLTGWIIFFTALALKFFYFITLENPLPYVGDSFYYIQYADNLLEHGVFSKDLSGNPMPDSYWAPGYPFFLAFCAQISELFDIQFFSFAMFMQAILAAAAVVLVFLVGRFLFSAIYALIAAILTAFSPHLMSLGGEVLSEILFCVLLLAAIYFYFLQLHKNHSWYWGGASGIFFGCAYLTNPVVLFVPLLLVFRFLFVVQCHPSLMSSLKRVSVLVLCFMTMVFAWSIRDLVSVPQNQMATSDRAFENLIIGAHSDFHNRFRENPRDPENPADRDIKKYKEDHVGFYRELTHRIANDPLHYAHWYFIQKPLDLWGWKIFVGRGGIFVSSPNATLYDKSAVVFASLTIMKSIHYWLFGLALIGFIFALREKKSLRKESVLVLYIGLVSISAIYVALHADARYSVPMRPEMYLCAMYAIHRIVKFIQSRNHQEK